MTEKPGHQKVLILGGGQLARMLAEAAPKLGLAVHIYAQAADESATQVTQNFTIGSLSDEQKLKTLFLQFPLVTFENEFIPQPLYKRLATEAKTKFTPSLEALALTQDKLEQKKLFARLNIPSAEYLVYEGPEDAPEMFHKWVNAVLERWSSAVLKWSRFGYDGKGNLVVDKHISFERIKSFYFDGISKGARVYAERKIDFVREVALQVVFREKPLELVFYPLVITEQRHGTCQQVLGPATDYGISNKIVNDAQSAATHIAHSIPLEGLFALEGFVTSNGQFLANEIAPRVHNSGHYTQHAASCSQFENHLRAVAGLPLVKPEMPPHFGMLNILGPTETANSAVDQRVLQELANDRATTNTKSNGEFFYWYGKSIRPGRKLGHINCWSESLTDLQERMTFWRKHL